MTCYRELDFFPVNNFLHKSGRFLAVFIMEPYLLLKCFPLGLEVNSVRLDPKFCCSIEIMINVFLISMT